MLERLMPAFDDFSLELAACGEWIVPGPGLEVESASSRTCRQLRPVLGPGSEPPDSLVAYRMYRGVCLPADAGALAGLGLRYDLTVLAGEWPGPEPVKTMGHLHAAAPGGSLTYPELYQVVGGQGLFLLQRDDRVVLVSAGTGEMVWVPPGYGHVTMNVGSGPLVMANAVARASSSDYEPFVSRGGAAWYLSACGHELVARANPRYPASPPPRWVTARDWNGEAGPTPAGEWSARGCLYRLSLDEPGVARVLTDPAAGWRA